AAGDPYFLYAASNLGSMLGLLGYPVLLEPRLRLPEQSRLWSGGYLLLLAFTLACAVLLWRSPVPALADPSRGRSIGVTARRRLPARRPRSCPRSLSGSRWAASWVGLSTRWSPRSCSTAWSSIR